MTIMFRIVKKSHTLFQDNKHTTPRVSVRLLLYTEPLAGEEGAGVSDLLCAIVTVDRSIQLPLNASKWEWEGAFGADPAPRV